MKSKIVLSIAAGLFCAWSSSAQLISYDGFNYTQGVTDGGVNGGSGWGGTWSGPATADIATNINAGLSYGGLNTTPGGVVVGNPGGSTATTATLQRELPGTLGNLAAANNGVIWISFLFQDWSTSSGGLSGFRQANLGLFSGATTNAGGVSQNNGTERLDIGSPNTYQAPGGDQVSFWTNGSSTTASSLGLAMPRGASDGNTIFLTLELIVDNTTAPDIAFAWVNQSLAGTPSTNTAIALGSVDFSGINALRLQAGNLNASGTNSAFEADEIRVGDTFADVAPVPEPASIALAILGGAGMFTLVRRRKNS